MTTISNGESGLSVRNKLNDALSKIDGTTAFDSIDAAGLDLTAIAEEKAVTAVDVFVYDTSKDSDGGAWRKRTQHTSWYNETLNTATRGARREFPAVAVIVAESNKVTIYDGDDPALPMWMVFLNTSWANGIPASLTGANVTSIAGLNGKLVFSSSNPGGVDGGVVIVSFVSDDATIETGVGWSFTIVVRANILQRNATGTNAATVGGGRLVDANVNDVAMTVLPDAPIGPATGLPVPTISVATAGGVSVITDSGAVYDSSKTTGATDATIDGDRLRIAFTDSAVLAYNLSAITPDGFTGSIYDPATTPALLGTTTSLAKAASGSSAGMTLLVEDRATPAKSMIARITSSYNSGYQNGDIKGAFLADTDDTDLVGGTDADRSVNANPLTVNGTITRSAVATGAELVAYSGFSASNYLEQPYNADLDFGTGNFAIIGWIKEAANSAVETILERDSATTAQRFTLAVNASGFLTFTCDDDTTARTATSTTAIDNGTWTHFVATYDGAGGLRIYLNGALNDTETGLALLTLNNASAVLRVGLAVDDAEALTNGSLALLRISATAPTAEAIKKIYNDEKVLFTDGAQATLFGSSDAVTALAHDPVTNILSVGTSAGRSDFQGLRRVKNTTTAVGVAISAAGGMIVEE